MFDRKNDGILVRRSILCVIEFSNKKMEKTRTGKIRGGNLRASVSYIILIFIRATFLRLFWSRSIY